MKKMKAIALILAASLCFFATGCSNSEEKLEQSNEDSLEIDEIEETDVVSELEDFPVLIDDEEDLSCSYTGTNDMVAVLNEMLGGSASFEGDFVFTSILTLNDDGTFIIEPVNPEQIVEDFRVFAIDNMSVIASVFGNLSEEELMETVQQAGFSSYEEFVNESVDGQEFLNYYAITNSGTFEVSDDTITFYCDDGDVYTGEINGRYITLPIYDSFITVYSQL